MRKALSAQLVIKAALFYFTVAGLCQTIHAQSRVPFRLVHNALIVVSVTANGVGSFDFLFDTGADTTIVDPAIAPKLSLVPLTVSSKPHLPAFTLFPAPLSAAYRSARPKSKIFPFWCRIWLRCVASILTSWVLPARISSRTSII